MINSEFHKIADKTISSLYDYLEKVDNNGDLEVDLLNGILHIKLPSTKQYVINKHEPTRQIWVSSPISGAHHFFYEENSHKWVSSGNKVFDEMVCSELEQYIKKG